MSPTGPSPSAAAPRDRFVSVNGLRLHYRDWGGPGQPFLALHGAMAHAGWWDPVAPLLFPRLRVLALDWRGHGRSAWPRPPAYRNEDFAADLYGVIERLGLTNAVVAGHSMGGHAALAFAAWHRAHLARLVVLDARPHASPRRSRATPGRATRPPVLFPTRAAAVARFRLRPPETIAPPALLRAVARGGIRHAGSGRWVYRFDPAYERTRAPVDAWSLLPRITAPTLVIRGEHSTILPHDLASQMAKAIPDASIAEIPAAYHHVTLDAPGRVAQAILAWLD